jgi:hypothetical protein
MTQRTTLAFLVLGNWSSLQCPHNDLSPMRRPNVIHTRKYKTKCKIQVEGEMGKGDPFDKYSKSTLIETRLRFIGLVGFGMF